MILFILLVPGEINDEFLFIGMELGLSSAVWSTFQSLKLARFSVDILRNIVAGLFANRMIHITVCFPGTGI